MRNGIGILKLDHNIAHNKRINEIKSAKRKILVMKKETKQQNSTDTKMGYYTVLATVFKGGNAGIEFDYKYMFRLIDNVRVGVKKILTKLRLRDKQSCKYCGRDQRIIWSCKDEDWLKLPELWHNKTLCLECFIVLSPNELNPNDIEILGYD